MGKTTEAGLKSALKSGKFERAYFLYGEEDFLTKTYADRIVDAAVPKDARDMNLLVYRNFPESLDEISDFLESFPFFSEYKCVLFNDIDIDAIDAAKHKALIPILQNIPETSIVIFEQRTYPDDLKKLKAKMAKTLEVCEAVGVSCEFKYFTASKLADMAMRKFNGLKCSISPDNAMYLAEECGSSLCVLQTEIEKLASYKGSGEVTREDIEKLVPKRIVTNVYNLAKELMAGRMGSALRILDALFVQRTAEENILAALSGHFTDLYRARLAMDARASYEQASKAFGYAPNRSFVMRNAFNDARYLSSRYLGECIEILYRTNTSLHSSVVDKRIMIERCLTEIAAVQR